MAGRATTRFPSESSFATTRPSSRKFSENSINKQPIRRAAVFFFLAQVQPAQKQQNHQFSLVVLFCSILSPVPLLWCIVYDLHRAALRSFSVGGIARICFEKQIFTID